MMRFAKFKRSLSLAALLAAIGIGNAAAAGRLVVENAWIRTAPPGAMMLAGYATLRNDGDAPLVLAGASSEAFGSVSLHKTVEEGGVAKMRPLDRLEIAAGSAVTFAPGGRHFMLMRPTRELKAGDVVTIRIATEGGSGAQADFAVRETAP